MLCNKTPAIVLEARQTFIEFDELDIPKVKCEIQNIF